MKKLLIILLFASTIVNAQSKLEYIKDIDLKKVIKKNLKFSTIYGAINGGTSISDVNTF